MAFGQLNQYENIDGQTSYQSEKHKLYRKLLFITSPNRSVSLLHHAKIFNGALQGNDVRLFCEIFVFKAAS